MPAQLSKGYTFTDGQSGYVSANLHALINSGTLLPGAITEQANLIPVVDSVFLHASFGALKNCTLQQILNTIPTSQPSNIASLRLLGTSATSACAGNDVRLPSRVTGLRRGNGANPDTAALPKDVSFAGVNVAALTQIDWDTADQFYADLTGDTTYTFANLRNGRDITIIIKLHGHAVTMPAVQLGSLTSIGSGTIGKIFKFSQSGLGLSGFVVNI